jgi:small-conductance mechanosensitive channel
MESDSPGDRLLRYLFGVIVAAVLVAVGFAFVAYFEPRLWASDALYIYAGAAVFLGYLVARAFGSTIQRYLTRYGRAHNVPAAKLFLDVIVATVVVAVLLHLLGVSAESLFFGSAFAGIILGLAGQTVLANVFAGLLIVFAAPFRTGERVALLSTSFGTVWPTYPRELTYSSLTGTIVDLGYFYTSLRLDSGRQVRVPNSVVIQALVVDQSAYRPHCQRVRVTLPQTVPVSVLENALREYATRHAGPPNAPPPVVQVADIQPATWDGVLVLWTNEANEEIVRDEVLRCILPRVAPAPKPASP